MNSFKFYLLRYLFKIFESVNMKKFLTILILVAFGLPLIAQDIDHDYNPNDRVPIVNATITKEQIPAAVLKAVNKQFDKNDPITWSRFPYALKEYGWVYDVGSANIPLNRYEVTMKTGAGNDFWAVYSANGELVETRELRKDAPIPRYVQEELAKSKYKGWTILADKEIIKYYHDHDFSSIEQHFRLTVEKDNVKRSLSFNYTGDNK